MAMLAEVVELVIGVDTHKHTHTAAVVAAATGAVIEKVTLPATPAAAAGQPAPGNGCGRSRAPAATAPG